ncbi:ABC transporter permease [Marinithermus hydrothermalis]|uniref:ABC-type transporter, integral membrane subunit n=1 Tax=Marinithermus hydrothermalis (strain DSM 14884 / JCM 11576 / T1) TaxID=869210 RepID=F2NPH0_MARHT|nr:ABC transporter permease [Marinithermus hydrothermalis]AEB12251.1 ABC-type transporter, integral membrane subunit [Marinithermus hydrothermalis DSM 14884]
MERTVSRVGVLGSLLALAAMLALPWFISAPNPIALGSKFNTTFIHLLALAAVWPGAYLIPLVVGVSLALSVGAPFRYQGWGLALSAGVGLLFVYFLSETLIAAGRAEGLIARVALWSSGAWLSLVGFGLVFSAGVLLLRRQGYPRSLVTAVTWLPGLVVLGHILYGVVAGGAENLLVLEFQREIRRGQLQIHLLEHLLLTGFALAFAVGIGVPLGIWGSYRERVALVSLWVAGVIFTIPSIALFAMLLDPLAALSRAYPALRSVGISGLGAAPAITALTLYALLPVIRNTYVGLKSVPEAQVDAARGMGMTTRQILWRVQLPRAVPVIMAGVRNAAVLTVGIATIAQLIGAGGLGFYIFTGIARVSLVQILLGTIPAVLLAFSVDGVLQLVQRLLTSPGLRLGEEAA